MKKAALVFGLIVAFAILAVFVIKPFTEAGVISAPPGNNASPSAAGASAAQSSGINYAALSQASADADSQKKALAQKWADAVKLRDGKAQYELLCPKLKPEYLKFYESLNWVTGVSSPWVESYLAEVSGDKAVITYKLATSTGPYGTQTDTLTFLNDNGKLLICGVEGYSAIPK